MDPTQCWTPGRLLAALEAQLGGVGLQALVLAEACRLPGRDESRRQWNGAGADRVAGPAFDARAEAEGQGAGEVAAVGSLQARMKQLRLQPRRASGGALATPRRQGSGLEGG